VLRSWRLPSTPYRIGAVIIAPENVNAGTKALRSIVKTASENFGVDPETELHAYDMFHGVRPMIPALAIADWGQRRSIPRFDQLERDLTLARLIVEIANNLRSQTIAPIAEPIRS
jgi:hypothetical protein